MLNGGHWPPFLLNKLMKNILNIALIIQFGISAFYATTATNINDFIVATLGMLVCIIALKIN